MPLYSSLTKIYAWWIPFESTFFLNIFFYFLRLLSLLFFLFIFLLLLLFFSCTFSPPSPAGFNPLLLGFLLLRSVHWQSASSTRCLVWGGGTIPLYPCLESAPGIRWLLVQRVQFYRLALEYLRWVIHSGLNMMHYEAKLWRWCSHDNHMVHRSDLVSHIGTIASPSLIGWLHKKYNYDNDFWMSIACNLLSLCSF